MSIFEWLAVSGLVAILYYLHEVIQSLNRVHQALDELRQRRQ